MTTSVSSGSNSQRTTATPAPTGAAAASSDWTQLWAIYTGGGDVPPPSTGGGSISMRPTLSPPDGTLLILFAKSVRHEATNERAATSRNAIDTQNNQRDSLAAQEKTYFDQLQADAQQTADANSTLGDTSTAGWILGGLMVLGGIFTGGATLAIGVTLLAAAATTAILKDQGVQIQNPSTGEMQDLNLNIDGIVDLASDATQEAGMGLSDSDLTKYKEGWTIGVTLALTIGMVWATSTASTGAAGAEAGELSALEKSADAAAKAGKMSVALQRTVQGLTVVTDLADAGNSAWAGSVQIQVAELNRSTTKTEGDRDYVLQLLKICSQNGKLWLSWMQQGVAMQMDNQGAWAQILKAFAATQANMSRVPTK
ncbi:MAG TPA: hypothetical protein VHA82_14535 [Ramlibacter sp.]|uniref:hypothetical protein n=1 Tax=Ramlibacter sp. TaxID=1917967 RepID=UPI002C8726DB|nr:hypothetical protein [Ramlibacter sp.]HVZ45024.1 hypothetical protein [Ramlibacter sp.]